MSTWNNVPSNLKLTHCIARPTYVAAHGSKTLNTTNEPLVLSCRGVSHKIPSVRTWHVCRMWEIRSNHICTRL